MQAMDGIVLQASTRSQKTAPEAPRAQPHRQREEVARFISKRIVRVFLPLSVTVAGANVHDNRLIGTPLESSRKMGDCFWGG